MALIDVKEYYYTMLAQYTEMKADLADFEKALADGYVTEDQLEEAKADVAALQDNLDRIQYIMYLWELPKRKKKKEAFMNRPENKRLNGYFAGAGAALSDIETENKSVLTKLRRDLKELEKADKDK